MEPLYVICMAVPLRSGYTLKVMGLRPRGTTHLSGTSCAGLCGCKDSYCEFPPFRDFSFKIMPLHNVLFNSQVILSRYLLIIVIWSSASTLSPLQRQKSSRGHIDKQLAHSFHQVTSTPKKNLKKKKFFIKRIVKTPKYIRIYK